MPVELAIKTETEHKQVPQTQKPKTTPTPGTEGVQNINNDPKPKPLEDRKIGIYLSTDHGFGI